MIRRRVRRRPGVSLVEVLIVIAAGGLVLGVTASLLHAAIRAEQGGRARMLEGQALADLARALRDDIHAARDARVGPAETPVLNLTANGDRTIEYARNGRGLVRTEREGPKTRRVERYALPADSTVLWDIESGPPRFVTFTLTTAAARRGAPARIEAELGRDRKFAPETEAVP